MAYLYKLYIVVDDDSENLLYQNIIDDAVEKAFDNHTNINIVSAKITELDNSICGKCCRCGVWVSDQETVGCIDGFSDGCIIDGNWWCDLCLPADHPKHFKNTD